MSRLRPVVPFALALALLAGACSSGDSTDLDLGQARQAIRSLAVRLYGDEQRVGGVTCPKSVEQKKGNTFACTVVVGDQRLTIRVDQRDDEGRVHLGQVQAVVSTAKADAYVQGYAQRRGTPVSSVSCARTRVIVRFPGQRIMCRVTYEDGETGTATMQVGDVTGRVGMQSLTRQ